MQNDWVLYDSLRYFQPLYSLVRKKELWFSLKASSSFCKFLLVHLHQEKERDLSLAMEYKSLLLI